VTRCKEGGLVLGCVVGVVVECWCWGSCSSWGGMVGCQCKGVGVSDWVEVGGGWLVWSMGVGW